MYALPHNKQEKSEIYVLGLIVVNIYLRLVKTKGVAPWKLRIRVSDCSFPSLVESSTLPEPEKGQNPLDLEPLPPIFSYSTLFSWVTGLPVVLQLYCTRGDTTFRM